MRWLEPVAATRERCVGTCVGLSARLEEGGKRAAEPGGRAPHSEEREEEGAGKEQSATPSLAPDTSPCVCADAGTPLYVAAEAVACEKLAAASRLLGVPNAGQEGGATTANLQPPSPSEVGLHSDECKRLSVDDKTIDTL